MKERKQVTIGIHRDKYDTLSQKKAALEMALGRRVDWGEFFLTLASQRSTNEIVAVLQTSEGEEKSDLTLNYDLISSWVTKDDMKNIVDRATDIIISELKKYLDSKTDNLPGEDDEKTQPNEYTSRPLEA